MVAEQAEQQSEPRWERMGPPYEMTRAEVVEFLREQGYMVTERQLQHWASQGVVPAATRKLPRGATDGKPRAIYPGYMATVIRDLLDDATQGRPLTALKDAAPRYIESRRSEAGPEASPLKRVAATRSARWQVEVAPVSLTRTVPASAALTMTATMAATGTVTPPLSRTLSRQILAYAKRFAEKNGTRWQRTVLVVEGADGQRLALTLDSHETPSDER